MQTLSGPEIAPDRTAPMLFTLWALAALGLSVSGFVSPARLWAVPALIGGTTLGLVIAWRRSAALRAMCERIDLRVPILYHVVRIAFGAAFLVMSSRGELDPTFALRAGWGDILAGVLAIVAALAITVGARSSRAFVYAFNVIGLLDMIMVVMTAQWIVFFSGHPQTMFAIARFPFSTIPPLVVPLVFATHFLIFQRLRTSSGAA